MQHDVGAGARPAARVEIADVAFDEGEPRRRFLADPFRHVVEVVPVARREVVEPDDPLPRL